MYNSCSPDTYNKISYQFYAKGDYKGDCLDKVYSWVSEQLIMLN